MAILAIITGKGLAKDMYETLRKEVKQETDHPDGMVMHAAGFDENGEIHVIDVWESKEKMDAFFGGRLIPVMQKNNMPVPKFEVYPAYNVDVMQAADKYK